MASPNIFDFDAPLHSGPDDGHARTRALLATAQHEMDEIAAATAAQIQHLVVHARQELTLLKLQVDVSVPGLDRADGVGADPVGEGQTTSAEGAHVSADAYDALVGARLELDRLIDDVRPPSRPARQPAKRLGRRSMAMLTAVILTWGAVWVVAARWMRGQAARDTPAANSAAADAAASMPAPVATSSRPGDVRDELRTSSDRWLRAYFDRGATSPPVAGSAPAIHDERDDGERVAGAARRVVAPARVEVFGEAAVLSTSVTEYPGTTTGGEPVVSLVSQLWTRSSGRWHLDEVRIVSARRAESAFRR